MFYDQAKPIGVAFWGTVNDEVEQRLAVGTTRLRPQDWKSGERLWVVEVIAPFGGAEEMVKDLKAKVFPAREAKFLAVGKQGREVRVV
jgi:cytolysin-activating lysine-acyltransferase